MDVRMVEGLYRRYWFQVERRCRRILVDEDDARDAAQEVFVRLITHGGSFRGDAEWMTWLYRIATNICLTRLRNRSRRGRRWLDRVKWEAETQSPAQPDEATLLPSLLVHFDEKTQKIAVHYFLDEMTQAEIASLVGMSRVSVNKRLSAFRQRARQLIATEEAP